MTTLEPVVVTCGLCGTTSEQVEIMSTSSFSMDLDTRPSELARSALSFQVAECPTCGYVGDFDLAAPERAASDSTVRRSMQGEEYRALRSDRGLPALARRFLCRALIQDDLGDLRAAGWSSLCPAWACDDADSAAAAASCRRKALDYWQRTLDDGGSILVRMIDTSRCFSLQRPCVALGCSPNVERRAPSLPEARMRSLVASSNSSPSVLSRRTAARTHWTTRTRRPREERDKRTSTRVVDGVNDGVPEGGSGAPSQRPFE